MFGFGTKTKISRVYRLLNEGRSSTAKAEVLWPRQAIEQLFDLSGDVDTTVALALLRQEALSAERMKDETSYADMAQEIIELAQEDGISPETFAQKETDAQVESAKVYADTFAKMLDSGQLVANEEVRQFCAENAVAMLASWNVYGLKLRTAVSDKSGNCSR